MKNLKDNQKIVEIHDREYVEEIDSDGSKKLYTLGLKNFTYRCKSYRSVEIHGKKYIELTSSEGDKRLYTLGLKNETSRCKDLEKITLTKKPMNKLNFVLGIIIGTCIILSIMHLVGQEAQKEVEPIEAVEPSEYEKYTNFINSLHSRIATDEEIAQLEKEYNIAKFPNDDIARAKLANAKISKLNSLLKDANAKDSKQYRTDLLRLDGVIKSTGLESIANHYDVYHKPTDLFYGFLWYDGVYVSQTFDEHVVNNGLKGIDVATSGRSLAVHAPDLYNKEVEWTVEVPESGCKKRSIGQCIYFTNETHRVIFGHMASWNGKKSVKTGDNVGIVGGCGGDPNEGISTGCHLHIEYQYWDKYKGDFVNFEYTLAKSNKHENKSLNKDMWYMSAYYTPLPDQKKYYTGSYEGDLVMNTWGDPYKTASGLKLDNSLKNKVLACPPSFKFGTKIEITMPMDHKEHPGESIIATCEDRGGLIKNKRLDIWAGIGEDAWIGEWSSKKATIEILN